MDFPGGVGEFEADFLVSAGQQRADFGFAEAGLLEGTAHELEKAVEAFVEFLLFDLQALGDVGDFPRLPEAELEDQAILGVHRFEEAVDGGCDAARGAFAVGHLDAVVRVRIHSGDFRSHFVRDENRPRRAHWETDVNELQLCDGVLRSRRSGQDFYRFVEGETVAREKTLERNGLVAKAARFGGWAPLAPHLDAPLLEKAEDDGRQIRGERRAAFELTDDRVVVIEKTKAHFLCELRGLVGVEVIPPRYERRNALDCPQVVQIGVFRNHTDPVTDYSISGIPAV